MGQRLMAAGLLLLSSALVSGAWPDPTDPPVWPDAFSVHFTEILDVGSLYKVTNNGTWYYDWANRTARFDHGAGQSDNFCQRQGLSPKAPHADCQLLFTKSLDMWVIYPGAQACCRLCGGDEGCTVLKPDWLSGGKLLDTETIGGRTCAGWAKKGAVAAADTWYVDQTGVPCRYHEVVSHVMHNITFRPDSYSATPPPPDVFRLPDYCKDKCPHPFPG